VGRILPFVIGVIGDFSAPAGTTANRLADAHFIEVDPRDFDATLARLAPRLELRIRTPDAMQPGLDAEVPIEVQFTTMADFEASHLAHAHGAVAAHILNHPEFLRLEGAWRGLQHLAEAIAPSQLARLQVLNVTKRALGRNFKRAFEFQQTRLYELVCTAPFEHPDGTPFGLMVCDFEFGANLDDIELLTGLGAVAEAACSPLLASASPALLGLGDWSNWQAQTVEAFLAQPPASPEQRRWRSLREQEAAAFLVLTLPRVLARPVFGAPHGANPAMGLQPESPIPHECCWMSASYVVAGRVLAAFSRSEWAADFMKAENRVSGVWTTPNGDLQDGKSQFATATEIDIADRPFTLLVRQGLMPLLRHREGRVQLSAAPTLKKPQEYRERQVTEDLAVMATLPAVLAVSRFMHYIRMQCKEVTANTEPADLERRVNAWLQRYANAVAESPLLTAATLRVQESALPSGPWVLAVRMAPVVSDYRLTIPPPRFVVQLPESRRRATPMVRELPTRASTLLYTFACERALTDLSSALNAQGPWKWTTGDGACARDYLGTTATPDEVVLRIYQEAPRLLLVMWRSALLVPDKRDALLAWLRWVLLPSIGAQSVALIDEPFE
jgi:type VI secretion system protein ImpC